MIATLFTFFIVLSILVIIHELGHFWVARFYKMKVEEFGFGYPPRVFSVVKKGVRWSFNLIPFGGFVSIKGEQGASSDADSFSNKPPYQRILVLLGGVTMNYLLAIVAFTIVFTIGWPTTTSQLTPADRLNIVSSKIMVNQVLKDTPADKAGLESGFLLTSVDQQPIDKIEVLTDYLQTKANQEINLEVIDNKQAVQTLTIKPEEITAGGVTKVRLGIATDSMVILKYNFGQAILRSFEHSFKFANSILVALGDLIRDLVFTQKVSPEIGGPVAIAAVTGRALDRGLIYVLQLLGVLSLNLAIVNIMPFPALDGGQIVLVVLEKIRGVKIKTKTLNIVNTAGFFLLISLLVFVTIRDVWNINTLFSL